MIEFKNVSKKYKDKVALSNCSLQIPKGQIIGLFGANGAGKTTFMKCMMGYLNFDGEITLDGEKIDGSNISKLSDKIFDSIGQTFDLLRLDKPASISVKVRGIMSDELVKRNIEVVRKNG